MRRSCCWFILVTACAPAPAELGDSTSQASPGGFAVMVGADGWVTTLARYPGGGVHPGVNAIDVGAFGGSPVVYQLGALEQVAGGWLFAAAVREAGFCSQWAPGSRYYNGDKIVVVAWLYGEDGRPLGWHRSAFQHVSPNPPSLGRFWRFNAAGSARQAWVDPELTLGDDPDAGLYLGEVFAPPGPVWNGPGGGLCTDGAHLHQEGDGARDPDLAIGTAVAARQSALHWFQPAAGTSPFGEPPYPPLAQPQMPPPADPCGGLGYAGRCAAGVLVWCEGGALREYDCAAAGLGCAFVDDTTGYNCVRGCGDLDYAGACAGGGLRWCEGGRARTKDCAAAGLSCAWQDDDVGYNCL